MKKIILLNKKEGETPLEALEVFRQKNKEYQGVPMTYAGRLDPMAEGLLLILAGEECKNKEKYLKLDKEYEFSVLFGFSTDTYDILGKIKEAKDKEVTEKDIKNSLKFFQGKIIQKYPLYSSKTIKKVRAGETVESEDREVDIKNIKLLRLGKINSKKLFTNIEKRINKVKGDFRQKEILTLWDMQQRTSMLKSYYAAAFKIKCGSGTYVRVIANELGERLGIPALAFSIKRVKIGKWSLRSTRSTRS